MWKRLTLSLVAVAALSALVMGASFALFTATTTNSNNTFSTGTVSFANDFTQALAITGMVPGDHGDKTYTITYNGNVGAWVGLDVTAAGGLFGCDSLNNALHPGLEYQVDNNAATPAVYAGGNAAATNSNILLSSTPVSSSTAFPIHLHYSLDSSVGNGCQNASATITLKVHAVQAGNNTNAAATGPTSWS